MFGIAGVAAAAEAMVAPYFSGLLMVQSDLGHPAGDVLLTKSPWTSPFRTSPQNLACGARRSIRTLCAMVAPRLR
jgi:hypothetical protein